MGRPQQPELNRSGTTPLQPDSLESELKSRKQARPRQGDETGGAVPEDNQPGHHPEHEEDKPDTEAFVRRFSGREDRDESPDPRQPPRSPHAEGGGPPIGELGRDLFDRIRRRDVIGLATFPVRAGFRLLRHYQRSIGAGRA